MRTAPFERGAHRGIAYAQLFDEFIRAFRIGPESTVFTPAGRTYQLPIAEVIDDEFHATSPSMHEALRIIRNAAAGVDVRMQACAWIDAEAKRHAAWHEGARATEIEESRL